MPRFATVSLLLSLTGGFSHGTQHRAELEGRDEPSLRAERTSDAVVLPRCRVEEGILRALAHERPQLQLAAIGYLGWYGDRQDMSLLRPYFDDPDPAIRGAAFSAVAWVLARSPEAATDELRSRVLAGVQDPEWTVRRAAQSALRSLLGEPGGEALIEPFVTVVRNEEVTELYLAGMRLLAGVGAHGLSADVALQLRNWPQAYWQSEIAMFLELLEDPEDAPAVRPLLDHPMALVRHQAARALIRLSRAEKGDEEHLLALPTPSENRAYWAARGRRERQLYRQIEEVDEERLLRELEQARVVLVGEMHGNAETYALDLRILRRLVARWGANRVVLGYEPPVMDLQEPVRTVARELGVTVLPLEPPLPDWGSEPPLDVLRSQHRDLNVSDRINEWARDCPEQRMLAIYGETHVLSENLLGRLEVPAMVVLTIGIGGLLPHLGNDPEPLGRVFALGDEGRHFLRPCTSWLSQNAESGALLSGFLREP